MKMQTPEATPSCGANASAICNLKLLGSQSAQDLGQAATNDSPTAGDLYTNLPELLMASIIKELPVTTHPAFRLTCRCWRDHLAARDLAHTVCLSPYGDWEGKAKQLKSMFPKLTIQLQAQYSGIQKCLQLLNSPHCNIVSLQCHYESHGPAQPNDWRRNNHLAEIQHLQLLGTLADGPQTHAKLQLEMSVTYKHEPPQSSELSAAFNKLLPFIAGLSVSGSFSSVVQEAFPFRHLSRLELTLPNARSAEVINGSAVEHLHTTLRSLRNLSSLQLHADCLSIQPQAVISILPDLPNVTSLKVDSGINPCRLQHSHMVHIAALSLGREVLFDQPPQKLQFLHLAYLSAAHRPMMLQLSQMKSHISLTAGYCDVKDYVQVHCKHPCVRYHLAPHRWHINIGHCRPD